LAQLSLCSAADLAGGGCISAFKWNGGVDYKGKPWNESLPTDSAVCLLMLYELMLHERRIAMEQTFLPWCLEK